ncbi:hypothetical protein [Pontimicrobium aquaticum]|uniref:Uncharacterized protein n=1 Tax=Pontimicrobium aquaticum TaxID=2565367 RepID=A0A4U0ES50_9FLAO|nr:hypothetical protein [Pontimicrobium aquaticum]TJY34585.1 hypothetical protein E5167_09735 [Pontimicrobium aquaticum]
MKDEVKKKNILPKRGFWKSTGGNLFWINTVNENVFWLGMNNKTPKNELAENWCHVGNGKIQGNQIILEWADIPMGCDNLNGRIVIEIISEVQMKVIEDSGNFGMSVWNWKKEHLTFSQIVNKHHY